MENLWFPPLFSTPPCNTAWRRNEAACKWLLIPSIKVNEVGVQLTQSSPWLRRDSFAGFDINAGYSLFFLCVFFLSVSHYAPPLPPGCLHRGKKGLSALLPHVLINFDVNSSPQDPHKLINLIFKKNKHSFTRTEFPLRGESVSQVQGKGQVLFFTRPPNIL